MRREYDRIKARLRDDGYGTFMENGTISPPVLIDLIKWASDLPDSCIALYGDEELDRFEDCQMFVLTTEERAYGALTMFCDGVPERICDKLGEGYYAAPKNINEFLIVPDRVNVDVEWLRKTTARASTSLINPEELMSDVLLYYDADKRAFVS